ncbi:hypothetical protein C8J57DRAFT_1522634 [Mycena rebaudengoi]|nr:hypothetical protein C8J57DRAFT_1522634 [Mycena rebaudengoi]
MPAGELPNNALESASLLHPPAENALKDDLKKALRTAQLEVARLLTTNQELELKVAELTALQNQSAKRGRKKKTVTEEENTNGYLDVIIDLGKSFGMMIEPWITPAIFTAKPDELIEDTGAIFKDPSLYSKSLTLALYVHVPERLHKMVDAAEFPAFASNFCQQSNAGRSSALKSGEAALLTIYADLKIDSSVSGVRNLLFWPNEKADQSDVSTLLALHYAPMYQML